MGKKCTGTQHQKITGVEKLVFLGDSVTTGTPPNLPNQYYRSLVTEAVQKRFGAVEVADCSGWGARTDDFIDGRNEIGTCFPSGVETKKTLVVFTMGGNDIDKWAQDKLTAAEATVEADKAAQYQRDAVMWLKDPAHFPNGSYVIFGNVYEYTDTSGDLLSCPTALVAGLSGTWAQGASAVVHFQEELLKIAVDTQTDMIFMLEQFCGHGYRRTDPTLQCYRGPNAPLWFDLTCIHPNPDGHRVIADMFVDVIDG
jgi:lysophospholipase L1-like esterase